MPGYFHGKCAVLTGPTNMLSFAAARRLALEGASLVFAGLEVSENESVRELMIQFGRSVNAIDVELSDSEDVSDALEAAERLTGRMNLVVHTLGLPEIETYGSLIVLRKSSAPLQNVLTCTQGAVQYMAGRKDAQILHLIPAQEIGAIEVEQVTLDRIRKVWSRQRVSPVGLSALYFERAPRDSMSMQRGTDRILEQFTDRLLEEDDWAHRVALEREIGDLVVRICGEGVNAGSAPIRSFRASPGLNNRLQISMAA